MGMIFSIKLNHSASKQFFDAFVENDASFILITLGWVLLTLTTVPFIISAVQKRKNTVKPLDDALNGKANAEIQIGLHSA
jgi:hypothetical protein